MSKKAFFIFLVIILLSLFLFLSTEVCLGMDESGTYSIYFMDEQVGYEEFLWREVDRGYELEVTGKITKPVSMQIEHLVIRVNKDFIPLGFKFEGVLSGSKQSISSTISDGKVKNTICVAGREQKSMVEVKRDAFLLPTAVFSSYMVLTKKYKCSLQEEKEGLSAYIIPQAEVSFSLSPSEGESCVLLMKMGTTVIELETGEQGTLKGLRIPSQNIRVLLD
ncbi:MAG: hypothetical protein ACOC5S_01280 [Acidobacteriota bacterium]